MPKYGFEEQTFGRFAVFVYDHNLLLGLPAMCVADVAPSVADCPALVPRLPGSDLLERMPRVR